MAEERAELPYKSLGEQLRNIRQKRHESVAEVSGAVEIDEQLLKRIEQGSERPSEDILMLLISHFGMRDDDAAGLWEMAGYDYSPDDHDHEQEPQTGGQSRTMVMIMAVDPRVIYSDGVQVTANTNGVILGFSQGVGTPQAMTTAKVGMSREQAYGLLRVLQQTLEASKPRQLPAGPTASDSSDTRPR